MIAGQAGDAVRAARLKHLRSPRLHGCICVRVGGFGVVKELPDELFHRTSAKTAIRRVEKLGSE